jgi:hypothetical protein
MLTDQPDHNLARLELRHRQHARIQDRIRAAKATGLANLPFDAWRRNTVWLELVSCAQDLTCWLQSLLLDGELAMAHGQAAAHPTAAHRWPAACPRPPADAAARRRLAMGHGPGSRIRPTADPASGT